MTQTKFWCQYAGAEVADRMEMALRIYGRSGYAVFQFLEARDYMLQNVTSILRDSQFYDLIEFSW